MIKNVWTRSHLYIILFLLFHVFPSWIHMIKNVWTHGFSACNSCNGCYNSSGGCIANYIGAHQQVCTSIRMSIKISETAYSLSWPWHVNNQKLRKIFLQLLCQVSDETNSKKTCFLSLWKALKLLGSIPTGHYYCKACLTSTYLT